MFWPDRLPLIKSIDKRISEDFGYDTREEGKAMTIILPPYTLDNLKETSKFFKLIYFPDCPTGAYAYLYVEKSGRILPGNKNAVNIVDIFTGLFGEKPSNIQIDRMSENEERELIPLDSEHFCLFAGWGDTSRLRF